MLRSDWVRGPAQPVSYFVVTSFELKALVCGHPRNVILSAALVSYKSLERIKTNKTGFIIIL